MTIKLCTGDVGSIIKNQPADVLLNLTRANGDSIASLSRRLFKDYPFHNEMVAEASSRYQPDQLIGTYAYRKVDDKVHVVGFMDLLPAERVISMDDGEPNRKLYNLFFDINEAMVADKLKSIILPYYGVGSGYPFGDFLTLIERTFDANITVLVVTTQRYAHYTQLPIYDYPASCGSLDRPPVKDRIWHDRP